MIECPYSLHRCFQLRKTFLKLVMKTQYSFELSRLTELKGEYIFEEVIHVLWIDRIMSSYEVQKGLWNMSTV